MEAVKKYDLNGAFLLVIEIESTLVPGDNVALSFLVLFPILSKLLQSLGSGWA